MKRYSTYLMMLALAFVSFSLTSCEVDWYEDNYCGGGYYDDELNALDLAEVLSGTWSGSMQYKDGESGQMYSWDVSMTFVQNNRYAIKGTGVEIDYDGEASQSLELNWYLDDRTGDIYITYVGSGKTFVMDADARKYGYKLKENDFFEGYMLGRKNKDMIYINLDAVKARAASSGKARQFGQNANVETPTAATVKKIIEH